MSYSHVNSKGTTYYLNTKNVTLNGGRVQAIYYFSKDDRPETGCDLPTGYEVGENDRTGLPMARKIKAPF